MIYTRFGSKVEIVGDYGDTPEGGRYVRFRREDGSERDCYVSDLRSDQRPTEVHDAADLAPKLALAPLSGETTGDELILC